jgi:hypothetical protein
VSGRRERRKNMLGMMGKDIEEIEIIKLKDGEALAVVWDNPGQMMRLKAEHQFVGLIDWKVQVIGLVVREIKAKKKKA